MLHQTHAAQTLEHAVYDLAASPDFAARPVCFAATLGGVYRSDDGGLTWGSTFESLELQAPLPASCVAVSPAFADDETLFAGVLGGILRSTDGGRTWTKSVFPLPAPFISALALSPTFAEDGVVFAATMEDGVFRSADRGARWDAWNIGLFDAHVLALAISPCFHQDRTVYAATESGVYCSRNGGRLWRALPFPTDEVAVLSLALSPAFEQDGTLFAGVETGALARSSDRGSTWRWVEGLQADGPVNAVKLSSSFPDEPVLLVMLDDVLLASHDGGETWTNAAPHAALPGSLSALVAPLGLGAEQPVMLGLVDGGVVRFP